MLPAIRPSQPPRTRSPSSVPTGVMVPVYRIPGGTARCFAGCSMRGTGHDGAGLLRLRSQRRDCLDVSKARKQGECKVADAAVDRTPTGSARVLIAADKFKGSLTAVQVAER